MFDEFDLENNPVAATLGMLTEGGSGLGNIGEGGFTIPGMDDESSTPEFETATELSSSLTELADFLTGLQDRTGPETFLGSLQAAPEAYATAFENFGTALMGLAEGGGGGGAAGGRTTGGDGVNGTAGANGTAGTPGAGGAGGAAGTNSPSSGGGEKGGIGGSGGYGEGGDTGLEVFFQNYAKAAAQIRRWTVSAAVLEVYASPPSASATVAYLPILTRSGSTITHHQVGSVFLSLPSVTFI